MTKINTERYAYELACMIPAVQTIVAGWCAIGNGLKVASKVPTLAQTFFNRNSSTFNEDMGIGAKRITADQTASKQAYVLAKQNMGAAITPFMDSVKRAIPLIGTYVSGNYLSKELNLSCAETLSLMPVVNVVVGGATIASNIAKIAAKYLNVAARKTQSAACHTYHYISNLGNESKIKNARFITTVRRSNKVQAQILRSIPRNVEYIGHGIARALPGVTIGVHLNQVQQLNIA